MCLSPDSKTQGRILTIMFSQGILMLICLPILALEIFNREKQRKQWKEEAYTKTDYDMSILIIEFFLKGNHIVNNWFVEMCSSSSSRLRAMELESRELELEWLESYEILNRLFSQYIENKFHSWCRYIIGNFFSRIHTYPSIHLYHQFMAYFLYLCPLSCFSFKKIHESLIWKSTKKRF